MAFSQTDNLTASDTSFWKTIEKPGLKDNDAVTKIWSMNDDTTDPDEHDAGDLKNPDDGGDDGDEGTCKPSGPYSTKSACTKACKGGGKCKSGSAGFPIPQTYYSCSCPVSYTTVTHLCIKLRRGLSVSETKKKSRDMGPSAKDGISGMSHHSHDSMLRA